MRWLIALILVGLMAAPEARGLAPDACGTPIAIASPVAEPDSCGWHDLIAEIDREISGSEFDRLSVRLAEPAIESKYVPAGWSDAATWFAELPAGGGAHWVSLLHFESASSLLESREAFEAELVAEFFVPASVGNLEAPDACFALIREESARAICLLERGEILIVGYSFFEVDFADAQLGNAIALARLVESALQSVDASGGLR